MADRRGRSARWLGRLGLRQALLLSVTLLPLGVILMVQIGMMERETEARTHAALTGATLAAGSEVLARIEMVHGAAEALATMVPRLIGDPAACASAMRDYVEAAGGRIGFAGFLTREGGMDCASDPRQPPVALPGDLDGAARHWLTVGRSEHGVGPLVISAQVQPGEGRPVGLVALSLSTTDFLRAQHNDLAGRLIALITFDKDGNIVAGSSGLIDAARRVPSDRALKALTVSQPATFEAVSASGVQRIYSVVPIVEGSLFMLGSWRVTDAGDSVRFGGLPPEVFATLMWLASLGTAIFGAERLVSRHIRTLGRSMSAFAAGDRRVPPPDLRQAPTELQAVGDAYARLTAAIVRDEAELENMLRHKDVLLREVHHRVKNNLQLIASIMNLQMRKAHTPEARGLLKGLQDRVMSLATVHRELYQTSGLVDIRADELLADITRQVIKMGSSRDRQFSVNTSFDPVVLSPDQAVPLALLMTEALTNAMKYAGPSASRPARLVVALTDDGGGRAVLTVANTLPDPDITTPPTGIPMDPPSGLGSQLLTAFAQQLQGQLRMTEEDGQYILSLSFVPHRDGATQPPEVENGQDEEQG